MRTAAIKLSELGTYFEEVKLTDEVKELTRRTEVLEKLLREKQSELKKKEFLLNKIKRKTKWSKI